MVRNLLICIVATITVTALSCQSLQRDEPPDGYPDIPPNEMTRVIHFNVGQADAMLLIHRGQSVLFDCGSPLEDPERALKVIPSKLINLTGKRHIDYVVISHYHQDHLGNPGRGGPKTRRSGLYSLLDDANITVGTLIDRGRWALGKPSATYKKYHRATQRWLQERKVWNHKTVQTGDVITIGKDLRITFVAASGNGLFQELYVRYSDFLSEYPPSENDFSLAALIELGNFELFVGGDLTGANIVRRFGPNGTSYNDIESWIAADVGFVEMYRVNHHGSGHSSNPCFIDHLEPRVSIVSSGHHNRYGHPADDVMERLQSRGDVWITGGAYAGAPQNTRASVKAKDIDVWIWPGGDKFWVEGTHYEAWDDKTERERFGKRYPCQDETLDTYKVDARRMLKGSKKDD